MTAASLAYLALVLGAYAVFVGALGLMWLRAGRKRPPAPPIEITQAKSVSRPDPPSGDV
ncbi:hypothetical protein [Phenylobacterium sp. J367]|uniref:hypothetical protein n=1 Tax=Phenylobacterium sp. J367 TaxID=2898435 RepID=UPI002151B8BB|nr:hypothetical protein [Phenylobacterium sp. J367]MCR5881045.1 hypothetical protein [Phenylobacterium sp. J367]